MENTWENIMKPKNWSMVMLLASAGLLTSIGVAQENAAGGVVGANNPPSVAGIPGEVILEGGKFTLIKLDDYVSDDNDEPRFLKWSVSGNKSLIVSISPNHFAEIRVPDQYWNGSEDITFTATDTQGASGSETVNFTVESVNNAPVMMAIPNQTVDEGQKFAKIRLDDFVNDVDHKKNQITWDFDIQPQGQVQADGDLNVVVDQNHVATVVIPDAHWYGAANIKFTASDPEFASDSKTALFTVRPVNDPPVFVKPLVGQTIDERNEFDQIPLSEYVSDIDDDITRLKWTVSGNRELKVNIDSYGSATIVIPNELWNGAETLTFTVTDPAGASASSKATFAVNSINDVPEFVQNIPDQTIDERQAFETIRADQYVKDPDHRFENLKWSFSGNRELKVSIVGAIITVEQPNKNWNGSETIKFKVTDPEGASAECEATFTVNSINDPPVFVKPIPNQTIDEKKQFNKIKLAEHVTDSDNKINELTWDVEVKHQGKEPENGTLSVNVDEKGIATVVIPDPYWNGTAVATFTCSDPEGASTRQNVTFTVRSINDIPVFKKIPDQVVEEKTEFSSILLDDYLSDADHDLSKLKLEITGNKDIKVNLNAKTREVTFKTPNELWNGAETLTFTAVDPDGGKASTTAKFVVKSVNDPPIMKDIPEQTIKEKEQFKPVELDKYVEDLDHPKNKLKWSVSGNSELKVTIDAGHVMKVVPPSSQWNGAETLTLKVTDPEGASDERTVTYTVESVNDVPMFVKQVTPQTVKEKEQFKPIKLADMVKDLDNKLSELTFSYDVKPLPGGKRKNEELTVDIDPSLTAHVHVPNGQWNGASEITFIVSDPEGAKATSKAVFTVLSVNDVPVITKIPDQVIDEKTEFSPINLADYASDADDDFNTLKWEISGNKDLKANITKTGILVVKTPNPLWNGSEKITLTVSDGDGAKARTTVGFTVKSVNDPPVMKDIPGQTIKEKGQFKPIELDNFVEDLDHPKNRLKWKIEGAKELKASMDASHKLTVTQPNPHWNGSETLKITVTDPDGASDSKSVVFTVESVNDAPIFVKELKDQSIDEKKQFMTIKLDDLVKDPDHKISDLKWSFKVNASGSSSASKKSKKGKKAAAEPSTSSRETLGVKVENNVATIVIPNKFWNGSADITFTATDPEGASASKTAHYEVRSINDPPIFAADAPKGETVSEGESFKMLVLNTLASDPDNSASSLKWSVSGNRDLKVDFRKDNTVIVSAPSKQWSGKETLNFTVTDPEGASASHKMVYEVLRVNDPPAFVKRVPDQKIKEGELFKQINLAEYVVDPDNKPNELKWTVSGNKKLKVDVTPGRMLVVTAPDKHFWCAPETIVLEVKDPDGATASQMINYEIVSVNDAPIMKDIPSQKIREKGQFKDIDLKKFAHDPDHPDEQLVWSARVEKGGAVKPAAPKASKKGKKGKKGAKEHAAAAAPAVSNDAFQVEIDDNNVAHIKITDKYWHGERNVVFTVKDPEGASASKTVNFVVESVNDAPVIKPIPIQSIQEKEHFKPLDLVDYVSDPDNALSSLKFDVGGTRYLKAFINPKKQLIVTTPDRYWNGTEKLKIEVSDPEGAKSVQQVTFEVLPINDPPTIVAQIPNQSIKEREKFSPVDLSKVASDPDNKPNELKWSASGNKDLTVEFKGSRAHITAPSVTWFGKETIVFTVVDPEGAKTSTKATFEVNPVNDPPMLKSVPPQVIDEKESFPPIDFSKYVSDPDNKLEELTWTLDNASPRAAAHPVAKPAKGKKKGKHFAASSSESSTASVKHDLHFSISDKGVLTADIPDKFWNGTDNVTVNVFDPEGLKASVNVRFTVKPVNDPPVVKEIPGQTTNEGTAFKPIKLDDYVTDPDHKLNEIRWKVSGAKNLDVMITAGREANVRPKRSDWFGEETVVFTASDPTGASDKSVVKFVVKHVNAAPIMRDIPDYTIKEDENNGVIAVIKLDQIARDKDNNFDELKWNVTGHKYLDVKYDRIKKTMIISQPRENWNGKPERLTFTVTDPAGGKASKSATFTVIPVNDLPIAPNKTYVTQEGEALKVNAADGLMADVIDDDGDKPVSVQIVAKPRNGRVVLNERDGSFEYVPNRGFSGLDEFTYKAKDPDGGYSNVGTVEINVSFKMKDMRKK